MTNPHDGEGSVVLSAVADFEPGGLTKLETLVIHGRWDLTGAGRAAAEISNGDLVDPRHATECWTASNRVYYQDDRAFEPTSGDESACAFSSATP